MQVFPGLEGKRVAVTAAASGLGESIAEAFVAAGARVHVCDFDEERLVRFSSEHPGCAATLADVADPGQVERLFVEIEEGLGGLDVLVNNAGIAGPVAPVAEIPIEEWKRTIDVNLSGQLYCARQAAPMLVKAGGGSIVNMASTAGLFGFPLRSAYVASKWAVIGLTKTLAMELGPSGVRVNAICPGSVEGERIDGVIEAEAESSGEAPEAVRRRYLRQASLGSFVTPADVTGMVLFVCSDLGANISGQALAIDGQTRAS